MQALKKFLNAIHSIALSQKVSNDNVRNLVFSKKFSEFTLLDSISFLFYSAFFIYNIFLYLKFFLINCI